MLYKSISNYSLWYVVLYYNHICKIKLYGNEILYISTLVESKYNFSFAYVLFQYLIQDITRGLLFWNILKIVLVSNFKKGGRYWLLTTKFLYNIIWPLLYLDISTMFWWNITRLDFMILRFKNLIVVSIQRSFCENILWVHSFLKDFAQKPLKVAEKCISTTL